MSKLAGFQYDCAMKVSGNVLTSSTIYILPDLTTDKTLELFASSTIAFPFLKITPVPFFSSFNTDIRLDLSPGV